MSYETPEAAIADWTDGLDILLDREVPAIGARLVVGYDNVAYSLFRIFGAEGNWVVSADVPSGGAEDVMAKMLDLTSA